MTSNMIRSLPVIVAAMLALTASAAAQNTLQPLHPQLKAQATVNGPVVKVGDLIDNAGIIANVPIFRAPDLGQTGSVLVAAVVEAVRAHALVGLDTAGLDEVTVTRASRAIPVGTIEQSVARALSLRFNLGDAKDITVRCERDPRVIYVDASAQGEPRVAQLSYDSQGGRFDAVLEIPTGGGNHSNLRLSGRATVTADVVTLSHPVERGVLIKASDLTVERRPRAQIGRDLVTDLDHAAGFAARNSLRAGQPLRSTDLMKPELVARNEMVTLILEVPGVRLTVRGKAIEGGAEGDVVSVVNEQSKRTLQGTVVGPGTIVVSTGTPRLAANLRPASAAGSR